MSSTNSNITDDLNLLIIQTTTASKMAQVLQMCFMSWTIHGEKKIMSYGKQAQKPGK